MINISIFKTTPNDDIQNIAATKLKEMILTNVQMLVNQLDDTQDIENLVRVSITDKRSEAEQSGMVFVLSDILNQRKTQKIFDQINMKTKILIDLDPENTTANDWKCGTFASSAVKSCFESRKKMTTKEMLIKVLYNHNKQNNHYETRALLLSALALGMECYEEKNNSVFCSKLMKEDAGQVMANAYDYNMNNRGISLNIAPALTSINETFAWATELIISTYRILQVAIVGVIGTTTFIPAILIAVGVGASIYAIWRSILWLKNEKMKSKAKGVSLENTPGNNSLAGVYNFINSSNAKANDQPTNQSIVEVHIDEDISNVPVNDSLGAQNQVDEIQSIWKKASEYLQGATNGFVWFMLSIIFKIPAWYNVAKKDMKQDANIQLNWSDLFKTVDMNIEQGKHSHNMDFVSRKELDKYKLGTLGIMKTLKYGCIETAMEFALWLAVKVKHAILKYIFEVLLSIVLTPKSKPTIVRIVVVETQEVL